MKEIEVYTDGACSGNPGAGGWGAILIYGAVEKEISGNCAYTTNNRMELTAVIEALRAINQPCKITVYTDSAYVCSAFTKRWIDRWQANGWKTAAKGDVENTDLWKELLTLAKAHQVTWQKVKGHADNTRNNRCDQLARAAIKGVADNAQLNDLA